LISYSFFAQIAGNKLGGRALVTTRRYLLRLIAVAAVGLCLTPSFARDESKGPLVFAAASLKDALDAINAAWSKESGKSAVISYAGSSVLAKQIEEGAPADVFISADLDWMDYLAKRNLIKPGTRFNLLGNTLVLIAPKDSSLEAKIVPDFPLAALIGDGKLAMANTESVPAGKYGKAALTKLGIWDSIKDKIAQAENVRAALLLVSRGEAPLGIVYATDANADPNVKVLGTFPADTHKPIVYPAAVLAKSRSADAQAFVTFLKTDTAHKLFQDQGFTVLAEGAVEGFAVLAEVPAQ
jgi:molybdate transport system substrate-binding protein